MKLNGGGIRVSLAAFVLIGTLLGVVWRSKVQAQSAGSFTPIGNMTEDRYLHTATLLFDGRVLIVGGWETSTAEIYDPANRTFTRISNTTAPRFFHSATLLADGRVLIAGGRSQASAEIFDPKNGTFSRTGDMAFAQVGHTATLLHDGRVLIAGGLQDLPPLTAARAELYDPSTGLFTPTGRYPCQAGAPIWPTATLLAGGDVLLVGDSPAQIYNPITGAFRSTSGVVSPFCSYEMYWHATTLLRDGRALTTGGTDEFRVFSGAGLFDPTTESFDGAGTMNAQRESHSSTLLPDGTVLIAGGGAASLVTAELFDPGTRTFTPTGDMITNRGSHTATLLKTGEVLITGGLSFSATLSSAELYTPAVLIPPLLVAHMQFDRAIVAAGETYSAQISGANLTSETFFDVRFKAPGSNDYGVVLNWQRGVNVMHHVPQGIASGDWTVHGVRPHQLETDQTGDFSPVSATIRVAP